MYLNIFIYLKTFFINEYQYFNKFSHIYLIA